MCCVPPHVWAHGAWKNLLPRYRERERCRTDARMIRRETVQSEQFVANTG
jgi:hypothetical protein